MPYFNTLKEYTQLIVADAHDFAVGATGVTECDHKSGILVQSKIEKNRPLYKA
jgi:hypothetical protein